MNKAQRRDEISPPHVQNPVWLLIYSTYCSTGQWLLTEILPYSSTLQRALLSFMQPGNKPESTIPHPKFKFLLKTLSYVYSEYMFSLFIIKSTWAKENFNEIIIPSKFKALFLTYAINAVPLLHMRFLLTSAQIYRTRTPNCSTLSATNKLKWFIW